MRIEHCLNMGVAEWLEELGGNGSIIWEPCSNAITQWWMKEYVTKEFYKCPIKASIFHPSHKIAHIVDNDEYKQEEKEKLEEQSVYLRGLINDINSMVDNPMPVNPDEINLKVNDQSRQILNRIHRIFVQTSLNRGRRQELCQDFWTNWGELKPGDFTLKEELHDEFYRKVNLLNYGCHDVEYYFYFRSHRAKNFPDYPEILLEHTISDEIRDKTADYSNIPPGSPEAQERVKWGRRLMVSSPLIPDNLINDDCSDNNVDVWMPQNCILGKSPTLCYLDHDDPTYKDINNGHQINDFGVSFTERKDRKYLRKIGFAGAIDYGFPLGRVREGKQYVDVIKNRLKNNSLESPNIIREVKIHDSPF